MSDSPSGSTNRARVERTAMPPLPENVPVRPSGVQRLAGTDVPAIRVRNIVVGFGDKIILDGLNLDVRRGEVLGFVGGSGTGKSVLTRTILGLVHKRGGTIEVFGHDLDRLDGEDRLALEQRWGVLFQHGALFSALTVLQNIQVPMREYLDLSQGLLDELARVELDLVGLP
ncbi:MAG: ATP-binding cassette domain-containing protein, partial [Beijerinckiaceae bacterium]|nr:ATP-binding cassette domain-containing protein [Beijerinckiaceae bacterium]